jgi:hypothetical protein
MSTVASIEIQSPEAWSRLENSPQWAALTDSQRVWVTQFLATGSALSATKAGYHASSAANARVLSYELAKNKSIVAALDVAAGNISPVKTEREILIATVQAQLKAAEKGSIAASKFTAQLERLQLSGNTEDDESSEVSQPTIENGASSATTFYIGQLVNQRDEAGVLHTGRVMAIGDDGRPSRIEEVS